MKRCFTQTPLLIVDLWASIPKLATVRIITSSNAVTYHLKLFSYRVRSKIGYNISIPGPCHVTSPPLSILTIDSYDLSSISFRRLSIRCQIRWSKWVKCVSNPNQNLLKSSNDWFHIDRLLYKFLLTESRSSAECVNRLMFSQNESIFNMLFSMFCIKMFLYHASLKHPHIAIVTKSIKLIESSG